MRWIVLFILIVGVEAFAAEEDSVTERLEVLEEKRGLLSKKNRKRIGRFVAEADLLYWKADVDGVAYATTHKLVAAKGAFGTFETNIKTRTPHFSYDPGFRLAFGYQSPFDLFDFALVWTRFNTDGHDKAHGSLIFLPAPGQKIIDDSIGLVQPLSSVPNRASAHCSVDTDVLDLQFARGIEISQEFYIRPYFSTRGLWCHVDWNISAKRTFEPHFVFDQDSMRLKVKNSFIAVGSLVGLEMDYMLPMGFGMTAKGAGALLYGTTTEETKEKYKLQPAFTDSVLKQRFKAHNSFQSLKGQWELFLGMFWQTHKIHRAHFFSKTNKKRPKPHFRVFAGFEIQQWPYIAQKTITQDTRERERFSLSFQGFTGGGILVF